MEYYRNENGIMRPISEKTPKLDPILGTPITKNTGYQSIYQKKPEQKVLPKQAGLGNNKLLAEAMAAQKYNQDNKYRIGGLNLSNRMGDTIGNIANILTR